MRKHTAEEMSKSGQIRDTKQKRDKWANRDTSLKIGTVPENPGRVITLLSNKNSKMH